jgi:hypothetical protein
MITNFVINLTHYGYDGARLAPEAMKFTSRILEGLVACCGLVEPWKGIGYGSYEGEKSGRRVVLL